MSWGKIVRFCLILDGIYLTYWKNRPFTLY